MRHNTRIWLLGLAVAILSATAQAADVPAAPAPKAKPKSAVRIPKDQPNPDLPDISYGPDEQNKLDVWLAKSDKPTPVVVIVHGGGFFSGDKRELPGGKVNALLKAGLTVASINYRLTTTSIHLPIPQYDSARAVQFIRSKAQSWNIDPQRVGLWGGSAGAGIVLWMAFHKDLADPASADPVARQSTRVSCVVAIGAQSTYDPHVMKQWLVPSIVEHHFFLPGYGVKSVAELDNPKLQPVYDEVSAIKHLTKDAPPTFLLYGQSNIAPQPQDSAGKNIHHPIFGLKLKEAMDKLGLSCIYVNTADDPDARRRFPDGQSKADTLMIDFYCKYLGLPQPVRSTPK